MKDHWIAVALAKDIRRKPRRVLLDGQALVLFQGKDGPTALLDLCPHRQAELSKGRVVQGAIECPYHGWRFDAGGTCVAIPGCMEDLPRYRIRRFQTVEQDGVVFVASGEPTASPYIHAAAGQDVIVRRVRSETRSTLIDTAENILDATHTHFTHKGLLRGLSAKRHTVNVEITGGDGWAEAKYTGEDRQEGLISRMLEGARSKTIGRFRAPGIAELEYWGPNGLVLVTSFHLRQAADDRVEGIGWLVGPRAGPLSWVKAAAFKPLFKVALEQDRRILRSSFDNAAYQNAGPAVHGPLDFLRPDIEAILAGDLPPSASAPRHYQIAL